MRHYGDIKELNGYDLPIVDVITGGSPCQDLSVAGNREGLAGERSGLFLEQIRIIKEMREHDRADGRTGCFIRPRFAIWENVEGAFSSNKGKDFQAVLTEFARIVEPECPDVPLPEKGKWSKSGCIYDELGRWSIAWRLHDAQFWGPTYYAAGRVFKLGTPQRRRRIALVADFGGMCAPEILFIRQGMHWYSSESEQEREAVTGSPGESTEDTGRAYTLKVRGGAERDCYGKRAGKGALVQTELSGTLGVSQDQTLFQPVNQKTQMVAIEGNGARPSHLGDGYKETEVMYTLNSVERHAVAYAEQDAYNKKTICLNDQGGQQMTITEDITATLRAQDHGHPPLVLDEAKVFDARGNGNGLVAPTIAGDHNNRITDYTAIVLEKYDTDIRNAENR